MLNGSGSGEDAWRQAKKVGINGAIGFGLNRLASKVAVRAVNSRGALYMGKTGYIKNSKGFLTETVRDATKIGTGIGTNYIFSK